MEYVKICGLKEPEEIILCARNGANAVGFIYNVPESPRNLKKSKLINILNHIPSKILTVIVFKPLNVSHIEKVMQDIKADYYQIHINLEFEELDKLSIEKKKKIIFAIKLNQHNRDLMINRIKKFSNNFFAFLIDNSEGHGKEIDFNLTNEFLKKTKEARLILAGGIGCENIKDVITKLNPFGIDASSSLESEKGVKDLEEVEKFLKLVKKLRKKDCEK